MANVQRIIHNYSPAHAYPVKGSVEAIEVGDAVYLETRFQGQTSQITARVAHAGSAGANAGDGRMQFAANFAGFAIQRHDLNTFDKNLLVMVDGEVEMMIANSSGVNTAATADIPIGARVGIAVDSTFKPIDDAVQIDGLLSATVATNQAIGLLSRTVRSGDVTARVHVKSMQLFSKTTT